MLLNVGPTGAVQPTDQGPTPVSQGLGSCYASPDQSRDLRTPLHHCWTGISICWPYRLFIQNLHGFRSVC